MIWLGPEFRLVNPKTFQTEGMSAEQLSVLFHEYTHYLQNIATVAGFHAFHRAISLWLLFRETMGTDFRSGGSSVLPPERREWVEQYLTLADAFDGDGDDEVFNWPEHFAPDECVVERHTATECARPFGRMTSHVTEVVVAGHALDTDTAATETFNYHFGVTAIMEGIAYEIDQIVAAGTDGSETPLSSPLFPYQTLRKLAERLSPGIPVDAILRLACLSLSTNDPAGVLVDLFARYNSEAAGGRSPREAIELIRRNPNYLDLTEAILLHDIPALQQNFLGDGNLERGVRRILGLYRRLLTLRRNDPFMEMSVIDDANGTVDFNEVRKLFGRVPRCTTLQENEGDEHDVERDFLFPPEDEPERSDDEFATLHCAIELLLVHIDREVDEIASTDTLDDTACPFYTCCTLKMRRCAPELCRKTPWASAAWPDWPAGQACWYGTATRASAGRNNPA
jgi:hypothetical protein